MTESVSAQRTSPAPLVGGWRRFCFLSEPTYTLGFVRMAFGTLGVSWALSLLPNLYELSART
jgi:hypothetical protein